MREAPARDAGGSGADLTSLRDVPRREREVDGREPADRDARLGRLTELADAPRDGGLIELGETARCLDPLAIRAGIARGFQAPDRVVLGDAIGSLEPNSRPRRGGAQEQHADHRESAAISPIAAEHGAPA